MNPLTFILHDDSVNTYGFRMITSGGNLEEFKRNPVMFFQHNDYVLPIGRWENIRVDGSKILADAIFDDADEDAMKVKGKVERNFIRMASIGTWAPEEVSDDPALKLPGQTGATITKWTLREASIVTIGANHNALRMYDRVTGELIKLSDVGDVVKYCSKHYNNMENLRTILNLQDAASDADIVAVAKAMRQENENLKQENADLKKQNEDLKTAADDIEAKRIQEQQAEAVRLVDTAIRDGRLHANGKGAFLALFDADFEKAKTTLESISRAKSVVEQIEQSIVDLKDYMSKSWVELDRAGILPMLKDKAYDLYVQKFKEEFGVEPGK